jgi:hypothetical protein
MTGQLFSFLARSATAGRSQSKHVHGLVHASSGMLPQQLVLNICMRALHACNPEHPLSIPHPHSTSHPGPALHAQAGDTIVVVLKNNVDFPVNAESGGLQAAVAAETAPGDVTTYK